MSYFRTLGNKEVDFVLENNRGEIIGIEVKASRQIGKKI
ncbi:MAG: DUF4143 domain-containing protein [Elusimicrobiaceae bacterium]|nr:DUF4143 domain-containing protein [Elusimicrobiaceae bacterium]